MNIKPHIPKAKLMLLLTILIALIIGISLSTTKVYATGADGNGTDDESGSGTRTKAGWPSATTMILCYKSPHASPITNHWLEYKILKLYTTYYKKVMRESMGKFWEQASILPVKGIYTTISGGETSKWESS